MMGGSRYQGGFKNEGVFEWSDGSVYKGEFLQNVINGKGWYKWADQREYEGE